MESLGTAPRLAGTLVRLYDGKMVDQFDHRFASTGHKTSAIFRTTSSDRTSPSEHACAEFLVTPQYWVPLSKVAALVPEYCSKRGWWISYREVTASTNWRTVVASVAPLSGQVHTLPALYCPLSAALNASLLACLNSFALDYCARLKLSGTHLSHFVLRQLPVVPPSEFERRAPWSGDEETIQAWLMPRVLELTFTATDLARFARDCGWAGHPFRWDEERRFLLRCELDAAMFHLYLPAGADGGWQFAENETSEDRARMRASFVTPRDAVAYIMDSFPIVRRKDEESHGGDYRTKRVVLEIYDELAQGGGAGPAYQTRLDPPPADPRCSPQGRDMS
jgi:hypothetical protein